MIVPLVHSSRLKIPLSDKNIAFLRVVDRIAKLDCFKSWRKEGVNVNNNLLLRNNEVRQEFLSRPVVE